MYISFRLVTFEKKVNERVYNYINVNFFTKFNFCAASFSMLIERVQTTLRFPHSHRIHKLAIPERRNSKTPSRVESQAISTPDDKTTVVVN